MLYTRRWFEFLQGYLIDSYSGEERVASLCNFIYTTVLFNWHLLEYFELTTWIKVMGMIIYVWY